MKRLGFAVFVAAFLSLAIPPVPAPAAEPGAIVGTVTDQHTERPVAGVCAVAYPFGSVREVAADAVTDEEGRYAMPVGSGTYQVAFFDCTGWDYAAAWHGAGGIDPVVVAPGEPADAGGALITAHLPGLVDGNTGRWYLAAPRDELVEPFYFGNPGDLPIVGDWDCDGVDTPGLYRQADGYVYLRNSNSQGVADVRFYFGDPGDVPLAGDFDGDGCDTVSVYRPAANRVFVINELGAGDAGLGAADLAYTFGAPGDVPFAGDFDGDGIDTVGMYRASAGVAFLRNDHLSGPAPTEVAVGGPGVEVVAGDFAGVGVDGPAAFDPLTRTFELAGRAESWEFAGYRWHPVAGVFGH